ncbi:hypothetical protein QPK87_05615 [Kamptonema cortianum]|nr:hypothetical protein [Geitlerinema splendidum]MDK3156054.1 hypothetical protein [Kamptonema cortianum]
MHFAGIIATVTLLTSSAFAQSNSPQDLLKGLFKEWGQHKSAHITTVRWSKWPEADGEDFDGNTDLWFERGQGLKVYTTTYWGDSSLFLTDGKTLLLDEFQDRVTLVDPIDLTGPGRTPADPADDGGLIPALFQGLKAYEVQVDEEKPILVETVNGSVNLSFTHKPSGNVITLTLTDGRLTSITYPLTFPWLAGQSGSIRDEIIRIRYDVKLPKDTFDTKPPKGVPVNDARTKTGKDPFLL